MIDRAINYNVDLNILCCKVQKPHERRWICTCFIETISRGFKGFKVCKRSTFKAELAPSHSSPCIIILLCKTQWLHPNSIHRIQSRTSCCPTSMSVCHRVTTHALVKELTWLSSFRILELSYRSLNRRAYLNPHSNFEDLSDKSQSSSSHPSSYPILSQAPSSVSLTLNRHRRMPSSLRMGKPRQLGSSKG